MSHLELRGIIKDFPGVRALDGVTLSVEKGRILALCGENGAGKSTLMKVLSGIHPHGTYEGEILIDGEVCRFAGTKEAERRGIAIIHQELDLFPELTVAENILLGHEEHRGGIIDNGASYAKVASLLRRLEIDLDPSTPVNRLKLGQMQLVEIARALSLDAEILVLDEPTSALSDREVERLFSIMRGLKARGVTMIYISHKLDELKRICDEITVLRDGRSVLAPTPADTMSKEDIIKAMVGRELTNLYPACDHTPGRPLLEVEDWQVRHPLLPGEFLVADIAFKVHAGEIFGIYGLMGSGRTEVLTSIFAGFPRRYWDGTLRIGGRQVVCRDPRDAIDAGIALVTEDRKIFGLVLDLPLGDNLMMASLDRVASARGVIDEAVELSRQNGLVRDLRIRTPDTRQLVRNLSGGNQQKVVIGKWLATGPRVLLMDEPTRGIDVGAKQEIYNLMIDLKRQGTAIVLVTSELPELLGMSDRIMVMHEGWAVGTFARGEATAEQIAALATGNA